MHLVLFPQAASEILRNKDVLIANKKRKNHAELNLIRGVMLAMDIDGCRCRLMPSSGQTRTSVPHVLPTVQICSLCS